MELGDKKTGVHSRCVFQLLLMFEILQNKTLKEMQALEPGLNLSSASYQLWGLEQALECSDVFPSEMGVIRVPMS